MFRLIYFLFLFISCTSCFESNNVNPETNNLVLEKLDQEKSIETNRLWLKDEIFKIDQSDSSGLAKFKVEQSLIETGINEVVCCLEKEDSAMVILPHHIAHGLTGDSKKIPPLSTVLYFIKLIDVN